MHILLERVLSAFVLQPIECVLVCMLDFCNVYSKRIGML